MAQNQLTKTDRAKIASKEKQLAKIVGTSNAKKLVSAAVKKVKTGKKDIKDFY